MIVAEVICLFPKLPQHKDSNSKIVFNLYNVLR